MLTYKSDSSVKIAKYPIISVLWMCKLRQTNGNPLAFVVIMVYASTTEKSLNCSLWSSRDLVLFVCL